MLRVAIYARYSSDNQRDASIEDQIRICREFAEAKGWQIAECYMDHAISGASMMRPGVQMLMEHAQTRKFDVILSEALDRLSRDQADIATIFKRLTFAGVDLVTLTEGEISDLHIGLKGTMNALFLKDLADKTRRGLRGRVEKGRSGGGNCYGYDVVQPTVIAGEPERGERKINTKEKMIILRIFEEYASGKSPRAIAKSLNADGIPGPSGKAWGPSTIHGNRKRGTGILNNELYIGRLIWNRLRYLKDPETGKRVSRLNPKEEWITKDVPDLALVSDDLWQRVKDRQGTMVIRKNDDKGFWDRRRPRYLLSGLVKCGVCGAGYVNVNQERMGCANARNKGTCENHLTIVRDKLEDRVLQGLQHHLMDEKLTEIFCDEYTRHLNKLRMAHNAGREQHKAEFRKIDKELDKHVEAIGQGVPAEKVKDRMWELTHRSDELKALIAAAKEEVVLIHPSMAKIYRDRIQALRKSLQDEQFRMETMALIRALLRKIILSPTLDGNRSILEIDLEGDLAGILNMATNGSYTTTQLDQVEKSTKMVAGVGFEPTTFRL